MSERSDHDRVIDLSVQVPRTPEEVWDAIATGPGISSWFVPHEFAEEEGARVRVNFGGGFMDTASVTTWQPPHRLIFHGDGDRALAYEWLVEARDGASCVVRLVCSGFGAGADWDADFHGQSEGWALFLQNLQLHLTHFRGQHGRAITPMAIVTGTRDRAFDALCEALGVSPNLAVGDQLETSAPGAPPLAGRVATVTITAATRAYHLVLQSPAPGTAIVGAEAMDDQVGLSLWLYLYGADAAELPDTVTPFLKALAERLAAKA